MCVFAYGGAVVAPIAQAAADAHPILPAGAGRDLVIRVCAECHAVEIVAQQHLNADGWKKLVELMANNGAVASDDEFDQIARYLSKAFPPLAGDGTTTP